MAQEEAAGRIPIVVTDDPRAAPMCELVAGDCVLHKKPIQALVDEPEQARPIIRNLILWAEERRREMPVRPRWTRTAPLLILLAILSAAGARLLILPLQDAIGARLGYRETAIHVVPWIENTYLIGVAFGASVRVPFAPALLAAVAGFAAHERILFHQDMSTKRPGFFRRLSLRQQLDFWTFGPASGFFGAALFLFLRRRAEPWVGYFVWFLWHSLWNRYWLS